MKYKQLEGRKSRTKHRKKIRKEERERFVIAWGADKTTAEILTELGKEINTANSEWVTGKASYLRKRGRNLPRRNYDGLTATCRRNLHFNLAFANFWKMIEKPKKRTFLQSGLIDYRLLEYLKPEGAATTDQLLELVVFSRVTLLKRLRRLEGLGFIVCTLADYEGSGRGYLWNIN